MARKYPPGPRGFLGLRNIRDFGEHTLEFALSVHQKYGDAVYFRMGPFRAYLFFHPDHLREILVTHWKKLPKLRRQVKVLEQWDGQGLLLSEGELWQRQHRLVQPAFAPRRLRAGRCWGLCRYRDLLDLKVHVRIPALENGAHLPVERPHSRLYQQMRPCFG